MTSSAGRQPVLTGLSAHPKNLGGTQSGPRLSSPGFRFAKNDDLISLEMFASLTPVAQPRLKHSVRLQYLGRCKRCLGTRFGAGGKQCRRCEGIGLALRRIPMMGIASVMRNGKKAPHPIHRYREDVALLAESARAQRPELFPLACPVMFSLVATMPRPKTPQKTAWRDKGAAYPHTSKPDYDNLAKAVSDSLEGQEISARALGKILVGRLLDDDRYIWDAHQTKVVAAPGESASLWACLTWDPAQNKKT